MLLAIKNKFLLFYFIACISAFAIIILRAFFIPFSHDEAATFFFYVQSGDYLPYRSHLYTNNHVLNSAITNIFYELAGSHRFVLRLPNILSFVVLAAAVYRFFKYFKSYAAKITLIFLLLLNIHFLDFFELCRGYGISMSFMTLGFFFFIDYAINKTPRSYLWFSVCLNVALAANLTLILPFFILLAAIVFIQFKENISAKPYNIILLLVNIFLLAFWLKFSLHLKEHGLLDSGAPDSYWKTTFASLILLVTGSQSLWMQIACVSLFLFTVISSALYFFKKNNRFRFSPLLFFVLIFIALVASFFALNKLAAINFPEDRTVLFLYVIFALALCFSIDEAGNIFKTGISAMSGIFAVISFILFFNLNTFCHYFYHVLPKQFYSYLEQQFNLRNHIFTVGGNPAREMIYAYFNYRGNSLLNPMDEPLQMHMNCDYYIASKFEAPYYRHFYKEILHDDKTDRVLLERIFPINRTPIYERIALHYSGDGEYIDLVRLKDSVLKTSNCVDVDAAIQFKNVPSPFRGSLVLEASDENNQRLFYKRIQFNWLADDLNGQKKRFRITTPPLPKHFKNFTVYIWNTEKQNISVSLTELTIFKLEAKGINNVIPESYYKMVHQLTDKAFQ